MASVLTLADAKAYLGIPDNVNTHDEELQGFIDAAEAALECRVGPLQPRTRADRVRGGRALSLLAMPAIDLTSVTEVGGGDLSTDDLYLNGAAGVVTNIYGASFPAAMYDVTYSAGRATCPPDLLLALKELLKHLWRTQRGPGGSADQPAPGSGFAMPNRVLELIGPHLSVGFG